MNDKLQLQLNQAHRAVDELKMQCDSKSVQIETLKGMIDVLVESHEITVHYQGKTKPKGLFKKDKDQSHQLLTIKLAEEVITDLLSHQTPTVF